MRRRAQLQPTSPERCPLGDAAHAPCTIALALQSGSFPPRAPARNHVHPLYLVINFTDCSVHGVDRTHPLGPQVILSECLPRSCPPRCHGCMAPAIGPLVFAVARSAGAAARGGRATLPCWWGAPRHARLNARSPHVHSSQHSLHASANAGAAVSKVTANSTSHAHGLESGRPSAPCCRAAAARLQKLRRRPAWTRVRQQPLCLRLGCKAHGGGSPLSFRGDAPSPLVGTTPLLPWPSCCRTLRPRFCTAFSQIAGTAPHFCRAASSPLQHLP